MDYAFGDQFFALPTAIIGLPYEQATKAGEKRSYIGMGKAKLKKALPPKRKLISKLFYGNHLNSPRPYPYFRDTLFPY